MNHIHTIGRKPMPRKIWKTKTKAVAANAAGLVPIESKIAASMKQIESPVALSIRRGRLPNLSTVLKTMRCRSLCSARKDIYPKRDEGGKHICDGGTTSENKGELSGKAHGILIDNWSKIAAKSES